ncbi:MAG: hypothetical protein IPH12_19815 [Saprospirales bacterium]|nr:hypothetical protein [Saprospirales bacterium]MBK8921696.1 hypothetical protein [Saprospirales bacterium]
MPLWVIQIHFHSGGSGSSGWGWSKSVYRRRIAGYRHPVSFSFHLARQLHLSLSGLRTVCHVLPIYDLKIGAKPQSGKKPNKMAGQVTIVRNVFINGWRSMSLARTPTTAFLLDFQRDAAVGVLANDKLYRTIEARPGAAEIFRRMHAL